MDGGEEQEIGCVAYDNKEELDWIHELMVENRPNISIVECWLPTILHD
ncbi:MAG: hypothetical protein AB7E27_03250 [Candidatus Methanomethylophilaceae archaeon]